MPKPRTQYQNARAFALSARGDRYEATLRAIAARLRAEITRVRTGGYTSGTQARLIAKARAKAERERHACWWAHEKARADDPI